MSGPVNAARLEWLWIVLTVMAWTDVAGIAYAELHGWWRAGMLACVMGYGTTSYYWGVAATLRKEAPWAR